MQEINSLRGDKIQLKKATVELKDEINYLRKVNKEQGKALESGNDPDRFAMIINGQASELRQTKRQKQEL